MDNSEIIVPVINVPEGDIFVCNYADWFQDGIQVDELAKARNTLANMNGEIP